jgi:hypothetical protein
MTILVIRQVQQVIEIQHWPTCHADYPEKIAGELPRQITSMSIGDGETVFICTDCGASVVVNVEGRGIVYDKRDPVRIDAKAAFAETPAIAAGVNILD